MPNTTTKLRSIPPPTTIPTESHRPESYPTRSVAASATLPARPHPSCPGYSRYRRRPSAAGGQDLRISAQVAFGWSVFLPGPNKPTRVSIPPPNSVRTCQTAPSQCHQHGKVAARRSGCLPSRLYHSRAKRELLCLSWRPKPHNASRHSPNHGRTWWQAGRLRYPRSALSKLGRNE